MNLSLKSFSAVILFLYFNCCSQLHAASRPLKILFVGNSITYYNDMPQTFRDIANEKGDSVLLTVYAPGGTGFQHHSVDPQVYNYLRMGGWDVIVLQPGSNESVGVPPTQARGTTLAQARILIDSAVHYSPCSRIMFYEISYGVWGTGSADVAQYNTTMNEIRTTNNYLSDSTSKSFVPAGEVLRHVWNQNPAQLLWGSAGDIHPNVRGSYLISCTFYGAIFNKPSYGTTIMPANIGTDAAYYQRVADSVVLNHTSTWRIDTNWHKAKFQYAPAGLSATFTNTTVDADSVKWEIEGQNSSGNVAEHVFSAPGIYPVKMIAYFGLCTDTITQSITIGNPNSISATTREPRIVVYPSPVSKTLWIKVPEPGKAFKVHIYNMTGAMVMQAENTNTINVSALAEGIYLIKVNTSQEQYITRFVKSL